MSCADAPFQPLGFGNATNHVFTGGAANAPVVGMAADPGTGGYWLVASDDGVFAFTSPFGSFGVVPELLAQSQL